MNKNEITKETYQSIKEKISRLEKENKEIADKIKYASLDGDFSENADWNALCGILEKSRKETSRLRSFLESSEILRENDRRTSEFVRFGSKVSYQILGNEKQFVNNNLQIEISSEMDSDPSAGKVSLQSPLGLALFGKKVGDNVVVNNSGRKIYEVKIFAIE